MERFVYFLPDGGGGGASLAPTAPDSQNIPVASEQSPCPSAVTFTLLCNVFLLHPAPPPAGSAHPVCVCVCGSVAFRCYWTSVCCVQAQFFFCSCVKSILKSCGANYVIRSRLDGSLPPPVAAPPPPPAAPPRPFSSLPPRALSYHLHPSPPQKTFGNLLTGEGLKCRTRASSCSSAPSHCRQTRMCR